MKLRLLSDLHFEFESVEANAAFVDSLDFQPDETCVLAGDIVSGSCLDRLTLFPRRWPKTQFLFVPGNHEYYGTSIPDAHHWFERYEQQYEHFCWLNRSSFLDTVCGATLWYPPPKDQKQSQLLMGWSDWRCVRNPLDIFWEAGSDIEYLSGTNARVLVTHMLPHERCISPRWQGAATNIFFVNQIPWNMGAEPKFWLFGHTHDSIDVTIDNTRCIANPRGYPHERNPNFDPKLVIEVAP